MTHPKYVFWLILFLLLSITSGLIAQSKFGSISGVVSDETGAVFPSVKVIATNTDTERSTTSYTGADGTYSFLNLEPGEYALRFELAGFSSVALKNIHVLSGQRIAANVKMTPGTSDKTVEVGEVIGGVALDRPVESYSLSAASFEMLPKSRTFTYFAGTAPGVNTGEIEGGIQVNGASGAENGFYVDNASITSVIDGRVRQSVPFEYLQEVNITRAAAQAENPVALGGVVLGITRSGGNAFHGGGHFYWSGNSLNAKPVQRLVLAPNGAVLYVQDEKSTLNSYEGGYSLGGPIRKDAVYFFSSASPRRVRQDQLYRFANGSETGTIERTQTLLSGFNKLSWQGTPKLRGSFSWLYSPAKSQGALPGYDAAGPNSLSSTRSSNDANRSIGFFQPQSSYSGDIQYAVSNSFLISGRGGYFWDNYKDTGYPSMTPVRYAAPNNLASTGSLQGPLGRQNTPITRFRGHDRTTRVFGQADVAVNGEFYGYHDLRAGAGIQKNVNNIFDSYAGGAYVLLYWDQTFTQSGRNDRGTYGYYEVNEAGRVGSAGAPTQSYYAQDSWRVTSRLVLNGGVRFEHEVLPSFRRDIQPEALTFDHNISPRAGGSFDLFGDGKVKLYGAWGRFIDWTKYDWARNAFGADIWRVYYRSLDTLDVFSLSLANKPGRDLWLPGVSYWERATPGFRKTAIDPDIQPMSQDQITAGFEYELRPRLIVGVEYLRNNLRRTIEDLVATVNGVPGFIYANPAEGSAKTLTGTTGPTPPFDYPKPVRRYDAVQFTAERRLSDGWFGRLNYTWSRLWGNYPGLANSDRILTPTTNVPFPVAQQQAGSISQPASNLSMAYDLDELLWDSKGHLDVQGPLPTDRAHVLKILGGYQFRKGSDVGVFFFLGSGTPLTTEVTTTNQAVVFVNGRGDLGRTPWLSYTDLLVGHNFRVTEKQKVRVEFNMLNAFNQKTTRHRFTDLNRGAGGFDPGAAMDLSAVNLTRGYDYNALIRASALGNDAFDPRYGKDDLFNPGFNGRLGLKWTF